MKGNIILKGVFTLSDINGCHISGMSIEEIVSLFDMTQYLLLTYNEFDNYCFLKPWELSKFASKRREYYDIICTDIPPEKCIEQITDDEISSVQKFTDMNSPEPINWLPSVSQNFCIYSHDESLYSYLCFPMSLQNFVTSLLKKIVPEFTTRAGVSIEPKCLETLVDLIQKGIYVDINKTFVTDSCLHLFVSVFESDCSIGDALYMKEGLNFQPVLLVLQP